MHHGLRHFSITGFVHSFSTETRKGFPWKICWANCLKLQRNISSELLWQWKITKFFMRDTSTQMVIFPFSCSFSGAPGCIKEMPMKCFNLCKIFVNPSQAGFRTRGRNRRTLGVRVCWSYLVSSGLLLRNVWENVYCNGILWFSMVWVTYIWVV